MGGGGGRGEAGVTASERHSLKPFLGYYIFFFSEGGCFLTAH